MSSRELVDKGIDITPEHTKRNVPDDLHSEVLAAYDYVESVKETSDYNEVLAWHGWALREAFLAGITYQKEQS